MLGSIQNLAEQFIENRDDISFNNLYGRIKPGLVVYAKNFLGGDVKSAEDVVADAMIKAYLKIDQYNSNWNFSTWVYKIVKNEAMQYIRKNGQVYSLDSMIGETVSEKIMLSDLCLAGGMDDSDGYSEPDWFFDEMPLTTEVLYEMIMDEIKKLPTLYKNIMLDRELHGMKYEDISEKYELELNTVKTRISRARQKICKIIEEKKQHEDFSYN